MNEQIQTNPEELLLLIGERELIKFKQQQQIQALLKQINEMQEEIDRLRGTEKVVDLRRENVK